MGSEIFALMSKQEVGGNMKEYENRSTYIKIVSMKLERFSRVKSQFG